MNRKNRLLIIGFLLLTATVGLAGRGTVGDRTKTAQAHTAPHGGLIQTVGSDGLELTFDDRDGKLTVYVLAGDATSHPIPATPMTVLIVPDDPSPLSASFEIQLQPMAQPGDPEGQSSRFVGGDARVLAGKRFSARVRTSLTGEPGETTFTVNGSTGSELR